MPKWVGVAASVVLAGGLYAEQATEGNVHVWGLVFLAVLAYGLGYGLASTVERIRRSAGGSQPDKATGPGPRAPSSPGAEELNLADRAFALEQLADLHEKGLLSEAELAAVQAELFTSIDAPDDQQPEPGSGVGAACSDDDAAADDVEIPLEGVSDSSGADSTGARSRPTGGVVAVLLAVGFAAGVFGRGVFGDDDEVDCSDGWPVSQRQCEVIIDASKQCPADERDDFRLVAQVAFGLGDRSLDAAIDKATSMFCADEQAAAVVTTTSVPQTTAAPTSTAAPTTTTAGAVTPSGKTLGQHRFWRSEQGSMPSTTEVAAVYAEVYESGDIRLNRRITLPREADPACDPQSLDPIISITSEWSKDKVTNERTVTSSYPDGRSKSCDYRNVGTWLWRDGSWRSPWNPSEALAGPPAPFFFRYQFTVIPTGQVFTSPWVRVDVSEIP